MYHLARSYRVIALLVLALVLVGGTIFMRTQDKADRSGSSTISTLWEYIQVFAVAFALVFGFVRPFVVEAFKIPSGSMEDTLLEGDRILVAKFIYGTTIPFVKLPRSSIGLEFERDLDIADGPNRTISAALWREFKNNGVALSEDAAASIQQVDRELRTKQWFVSDGNNTYTIVRKRNELKIYTKLRILDFHKPAIGDVFVFKPPPRAGRKQNFIKRIVGLPGDVIEIRDWNLYRNGAPVSGENYVKRSSPRGGPRNLGPLEVPPRHVFAMGDNRDKSNDSRFWGFVPFENIRGQAFLKYWSWDPETKGLLHKIRFSRIGRRVK